MDRYSCWKTIAEQASFVIPEQERADILSTVDHVFAIDWSSLPAIYNLMELGLIPPNTSLIYFVFRVFTASKELFRSNADFTFYLQHESRGVERANYVMLLSHVDQNALLSGTEKYHRDSSRLDCSRAKMNVLVPPLRHGIQLQAISIEKKKKKRKKKTGGSSLQGPDVNCQYILCNARLSPEKNVLRFAQVKNGLSQNGTLQRLNLTPLMIGACRDKEYAQIVYDLLPSNTVKISQFMNTIELSTYLQQTVLNIHPSVCDAFGMTVAEAAAFGVPTVLHYESIGATSLFRQDCGEVFVGDMSSMEAAIESVDFF